MSAGVTLDFSKAQKLEAPPTLDFTKAQPLPGAEPDQFAKDRAVTEAWAQNHKILGPIARLLVQGGQDAASTITGTPGAIYHAIVDPPTPEEAARGPEDRVIARLLGLNKAAEAAKSYARGEVTPKGALSVLPEALGSGLGQTAGGAVYGKLGEVAGEVAPAALEKAAPVVRTAVKTANKVLPRVVGGGVGGAVGAATHIPFAAPTLAAIGAAVGPEVIPKWLRVPGEGFGLPNRVAGGPPVAPSYAESLGPVAGGPVAAPSYAESLGPVTGGPEAAPSYAESLGPRVKGGPRRAPSYEEFSGKLADMNKPAVADMSTIESRLRSIENKLQKEKAPAPEEEDLTAKGQKSVEAAIDNKVLGFLKKQGEGLTVSMQQLAKAPELSRFTPEQLQASAVRLRDAGKVWGHEARAGGEATERIYGIASR